LYKKNILNLIDGYIYFLVLRLEELKINKFYEFGVRKEKSTLRFVLKFLGCKSNKGSFQIEY